MTDPNGYVSKMSYTAGREPFLTLSPDPDGAGSLRNRMTVIDRYADGSVWRLKTGTGNADFSNFTEMQRVEYGYDAAVRKTYEYQVVNGAMLGLKEYNYDTIGRLDCTNQRMGSYSNVIGQISPCDLSPVTSLGPDRITRTEYDAASRVTRTWAGYRTATSYPTDYNWTNNNRLERVIDPKSQSTTYYYDGFDRLRFTCFTTTSCGSAPIYEETFYDANSNVTARRLRDGTTVNYQFDALNQLTVMTPPTVSWQDKPTRYSYDNQGHVVSATIDTWNLNTSYAYDALGRLTKETSPNQATDFGYDAGGRLTFLGYGDGYYVNYDYYNTGEMQRVRENGATSGTSLLATISIDNYGRRTGLTRGDGSSESRTYSHYGNGPWLTQLTQSMTNGGANTLSLYYNTQSNIVSRSSSNDSYAWRQTFNINRGYSVNGLNQYTQSGSIGLGYDGRGNLTGAPTPLTGSNGTPSGSTSYVYNVQNMLVSVGSNKLYYDALGRLGKDDAAQRVFGYAGPQLLMERSYDSSQYKRYVYGPDATPLVMYEDTSIHAKRYLVPDERGSVIAVTNGQGGRQNTNTYDEFGIPGSGNYGRFGYTGQAWNTTMQMWNYKARIYSPNLGRFMQPDPIGYGDGLNMYNYVGGDPVNFTDPSGLRTTHPTPAPGANAPNQADILVVGQRGCSLGFGCQSYTFDPFPGIDLDPVTRLLLEQVTDDGSEIVVVGRRVINSQLDRLKRLYCSLPSVGVGGTASGYDVVGGGISTGLTFDPQSGRLGVSAGINVGVGVGFNIAGSATLNTERSVPNGVSASLGANANVRVPGARVGVASTLINTRGFNPQFNGVSGGLAPGVGLTANANLSANIGVGLQVLPSCQ